MKKYLLLLLAVSASLWVLAADNYYGLEEIRDQWKSRNIKVPNGRPCFEMCERPTLHEDAERRVE